MHQRKAGRHDVLGERANPEEAEGRGDHDYVILFSSEELVRVHNLNDDAVIVFMTIAKYPIKKILVDCASLNDILSYDAFIWMDSPLNHLKSFSVPLFGFTGDLTRVEGKITFPITVGRPPY